MSRRAAAWAGWSAAAASLVFCTAGLVLTVAGGATGESGPLVMFTVAAAGLAFAVVGALIVPREPANPIAWLFCGVGAFVAAAVLLNGVAETGDAAHGVALLGVWVGAWAPYAALFPVAIYVPLLFPDGRLPSPRWRPVAACGGAGVAFAVLGTATAPGSFGGDFADVANPLGIDGAASRALKLIGFALAIAAFATALAAPVSRYRQAGDLQRQQIKLLAGAAAVTACTTIAGVIARSEGLTVVRDILSVLGVLAIPVAIAVAMLRYRLYDVDRLISRSLSYAVVTLVLAAAYAALVLAGQALFSSFAGGSNLAIAISTLVVAALFLPLRRRVRLLVDSRFHRRRYDAARTLEAFGGRLRQQLELEGLSADLEAVVHETMQPSHVFLWFRNDSVTAASYKGR